MTKDVLVSISGLHTEFAHNVIHIGNEPEEIEVVTPASYYLKNGKHYIIYDEAIEGSSEATNNKIKIADSGSVEIMKTGALNVHMVFEKGKKNLTYYQTPYGQMLVGVNTRELSIDESDDTISVKIDYELEVNHEPLADCRINMNVYSKGTAAFEI